MGYGAVGNEAPTNLLTGFGFFNPYWLIDIANVFMVHLVGAYQVNIAPYPLQSLQDLPGIIILP